MRLLFITRWCVMCKNGHSPLLFQAENDKFKVEENVPKEAMEAIYDQDNQVI